MTGPPLYVLSLIRRVVEEQCAPLGLVPPYEAIDGFICASVARNGGHNGEVIVFDDFLHHLCGLKIPKHVPSPQHV